MTHYREATMGKTTALAATALALVAAVTLPTAADAGNRNQAAIGDVTGDGLPDSVTFGPHSGSWCQVNIAPGLTGGGFGTATGYGYSSPQAWYPYCPDTAEVLDLGGDGTNEIVTTNWDADSRYGAVVVLRKDSAGVQAVGTYDGVAYPTTLRQADFNGDGLRDVWFASDESMSLRTYHNTASGDLVLGTIDECSQDKVPPYSLADFDGDGGQDILATLNCGGSKSAVLLSGSGKAKTTFASSPYGGVYTLSVVSYNADAYPDVRLVFNDPNGSGTRYYINDGAGNLTLVP
ncbi:VCBS repeat-containing protein [Actinokineospora sp. NBRC 105648]|uniref:FG-GAP repeat domain-containing protein n=1 Tax=Actinokineospora sp. NBRC 105648 TaxID=3032206 RepID=UPI00249FE393|nr:VCBS repeat-containing protein [Actinokineospora sp. NBRC 105648]GLZ39712.1 hypothetical protein Acsp05_33360 [Actinokineospora sp. NBRC 105648]